MPASVTLSLGRFCARRRPTTALADIEHISRTRCPAAISAVAASCSGQSHSGRCALGLHSLRSILFCLVALLDPNPHHRMLDGVVVMVDAEPAEELADERVGRAHASASIGAGAWAHVEARKGRGAAAPTVRELAVRQVQLGRRARCRRHGGCG
ncbi:hypothetical protein CC85DRAFT_24221 [Cutaneotrichosporon oleaginosum]|uniref:Uncharacterized protein n=1 Tax=Cutaneotrichosporon oleaginosum TaxID=879819 RepID=A0A0J0XT29_9TREE|nr:uncharacterized protein CC85DRAFT_24221 [Cutaneotrichosporon oleaginosum]KLT44232.1 hypothetical protein CC85DRAFT_24221 [Cutaneotrichosporon oleaginosum]TXT11600.1 hypothetical protein COLE_02010 [Cutaneotrichosporon oleaginosum]